MSGRRLAHKNSWRSAAIQTLGWASCSASSACSRLFSSVFSLLPLGLCGEKSSTKNPPVRAGSFALLMLSKPKIPDLDRALLLGFLGERYSNHFSSFTDNGTEFNALPNTLQCASCLKLFGKWHKRGRRLASMCCAILLLSWFPPH